MTSWKADTISGGVLAVFGLILTVLSYDLGWMSDGRARPGLLAGVSGTLTLVTGTYIVVRAVARKRSSSAAADTGTAAPGVSKDTEDATARRDHKPSRAADEIHENVVVDESDGSGTLSQGKPVAATFVLVLVAIYAARWLGFIVSFAVMMFVLLFVVERVAFAKAAVYAVGVSALAWTVFDLGLRIPLPTGVWG